MKHAKTYGFVQDKNGTRYRVTSQAVAQALKEADERVANLKALAERYAAAAESSERAYKSLLRHWWVRLGCVSQVIQRGGLEEWPK